MGLGPGGQELLRAASDRRPDLSAACGGSRLWVAGYVEDEVAGTTEGAEPRTGGSHAQLHDRPGPPLVDVGVALFEAQVLVVGTKQ